MMTQRTFTDWIELLCGQALSPTPYAKQLLEFFPDSGLGRSQLNEILLAAQLDRMGDGLFRFIFDGQSVDDFEDFTEKIEAYRVRAAVQFGNFKFAYKYLRDKTYDEIMSSFHQRNVDELERLRNRHRPIAELKIIEPKDTYYLGYIVDQELKDKKDDVKFSQLVMEARDKGATNHDIYLDYDHLDVYIATSMREKLDFWNVARFSQELQARSDLQELSLRFFDPTQAYCRDRIDKGLVEGLMLKRAKCTIYLAGESETLGKDSELAATLAQGKTVIAYVPKLDVFEKFRSDYVQKVLQEVYPAEDPVEMALKFLQIYWPNGAWVDSQVRGWLENRKAAQLDDVLRVIYDKARALYEGKARVLKDIHPLGLQVNLETGVANGVLVARTLPECSRLLRSVVLGNLQFRLEDRDGVVAVVETTTGSIYRVVTKDPHLTNSFWNFYFSRP